MQKLMVLLEEVSEAGCPSSSSASAVRTRGGCASKLYHPLASFRSHILNAELPSHVSRSI